MDRYANKKSTARLRFLRPDGTPAANEAVQFSQTGHEFLFGCGAFDAVELMKDNLPAEVRTLLSERMDNWFELFNFGTLPFYWGRYQPEDGGPTTTPYLMKAAKWLEEKGCAVKGHPLCWHTACANWLMNYSNEEILKKQIERIHTDVTHFKGTIDMWDVINEVVIMPVFDKYDNAITRICRDMGRIKLVKEVFAAAKESNPGATLLINDFNTSMAYEVLIDALLCADVPISVIGIQSHQHQGFWGLEKLNEVLERFSRFGLPIHFTENTFVSGDLMPLHIVDLNDWQVPEWPTTPEGEERQAQNVVDMYSTLFAHPLVEAITTWDPADGAWLGAPSGFMRKDNSKKPAFHALHDLIHKDWSTNVTLTTDAEGYVDFTGFRGGYEAKLGGSAVNFQLKGSDAQELTI